MTPEKLYDKWHEKLQEVNEEVRFFRRKYHDTRSHDDEMDMFVAARESNTIREFLEDVRKLNPNMDSKY
ncbi:hypothetical protein [Oceanobacillus alkalisoli]|uniref:hypothetical protein n=1 Tax=Oceanobacillus alkalisoli TaxID=2925113 RepID=UPI001EE4CD12|nr:hypothetical protein [Oceanobacillus alkalisoli]MCG5104428.1 hypothetical protein [Oceanobacillus alkalisoli]